MYNLTVENLTRVNNDVNGNPRYVFHFLALADHYGGGIVFQSYNVQNDLDMLNAYIEENSN